MLGQHNVTDIFELTIEDLVNIDGFAELSATTIFEGLRSIEKEFYSVYQFGFNLKATKKSALTSDLLLYGELIVFTGTMEHGKRPDMEAEAKKLGAKVGTSVTSKTTLLVTGKNVGEKKIAAATDKGVRVLNESEYLSMIKAHETLHRYDGGTG